MRFIADGPEIPDELLIARDQGRVVFICGAGVSRARANLPDFWGLAEGVIKTLGVLSDEPVSRIIQSVRCSTAGELKTISADRLFGMLEQDFEIHDVYSAVSKALQPQLNCDLKAHQILLDLATTNEGLVRLVTTNFDLLFNDCSPNLRAYVPPQLPDPKRSADFNGVVYLHGRVNATYGGAEGDGFVLSSSEFGRAYLSEAWATAFIKDILHKYIVVFVGYSADDPPMQYLLEALHKNSDPINAIYAFQANSHNEANSHWKQKGVIPIGYRPDNFHEALWDTLDAWAKRAKDPTRWTQNIVEKSLSGPASLEPHVRGQVAHVVSTYEGAKAFCSSGRTPPAEWLSVFDSAVRLAEKKNYVAEDERPNVEVFGLDSDHTGMAPRDGEVNSNRFAWNAFEFNYWDKLSIGHEQLSGVFGSAALFGGQLLPRLRQLALWISKVYSQPEAIRWVAAKNGIHPTLQDFIASAIRDINPTVPNVVNDAWRYILENQLVRDNRFEIYNLHEEIERHGWNARIVRKFGEYFMPRLEVGPPYNIKPAVETDRAPLKLHELIRLEVRYRDMTHPETNIPDEWLAQVLVALRNNLEMAVRLESEISPEYSYHLNSIVSLRSDEGNTDAYSRSHGLSGQLVYFSNLFLRLISLDRIKAFSEYKSWTSDDDTVFTRLRIWVSGYSELISKDEFMEIFDSLNEDSLWDSGHKRDLLLSLKNRWPELSPTERERIEHRILNGPENWGEDEVNYQRYKSYCILERVHWMNLNGMQLNCDIDSITSELITTVPDWHQEHANDAAKSNGIRSGWITKNPDFSALIGVPLPQVLKSIYGMSGRSHDFIENDPFLGITQNRPVLAFRILSHAAKSDQYPSAQWSTFLGDARRKTDSPRAVNALASRLKSYGQINISRIIPFVSRWLMDLTPEQHNDSKLAISNLLLEVVGALKIYQQSSSKETENKSNIDWVTRSINSPAGHVATALFSTPHVSGKVKLLSEDWLSLVEALIGLPGDAGRHATVIFNKNLSWFYHLNSRWTNDFLLPMLNNQDPVTKDAAWQGFLWSETAPGPRLYKLLKPYFFNQLNLERTNSEKKKRLIELILAGWASKKPKSTDKYIQDDELISLIIRQDDGFREYVLATAYRWSMQPESKTRWHELMLDLLAMWPRRKSLKSPLIVNQLLRIAFNQNEDFVKVFELILPLVVNTESRLSSFYELTRNEGKLIKEQASEVLTLLSATLPDDASKWPYDSGEVFKKLEEAAPHLKSDERLLRLNRLRNSR